jgi:hypothetical protein
MPYAFFLLMQLRHGMKLLLLLVMHAISDGQTKTGLNVTDGGDSVIKGHYKEEQKDY